MIKIRMAAGDGHPIVMLGLEPRNLELLAGDRPIPVKLSELGLYTDIEVVIVGPGTLDVMRAKGFLPQEEGR